LVYPYPSQLGFAYGKHLGATPSPFQARFARKEGRKLADAAGRAAAPLRRSRFMKIAIKSSQA
jgi:hypothetical protein